MVDSCALRSWVAYRRMMPNVTVVLPCLNEAASLPSVLAALPDGYRALVVDNNSTDGTADVARRHGAEVVAEPRPGYGSAVHAGVEAATTPIVAVIDADGSLDARELPALVDELDHGADMRVARREALLALGVTDRRSGYPLELLVRAAQAGWRVVERDVTYGPRTGGKSKISGSVRGSFFAALDFWRVIS
jgi:glycosyltransferase involved in cell wall biosynthesis